MASSYNQKGENLGAAHFVGKSVEQRGQRVCTALTRDGRPCRSFCLVGENRCLTHSGGASKAKMRIAKLNQNDPASADFVASLDMKGRKLFTEFMAKYASDFYGAMRACVSATNAGGKPAWDTRYKAASFMIARDLDMLPEPEGPPPHYATKEEALALVAALRSQQSPLEAGYGAEDGK